MCRICRVCRVCCRCFSVVVVADVVFTGNVAFVVFGFVVIGGVVVVVVLVGFAMFAVLL